MAIVVTCGAILEISVDDILSVRLAVMVLLSSVKHEYVLVLLLKQESVVHGDISKTDAAKEYKIVQQIIHATKMLTLIHVAVENQMLEIHIVATNV